MIVTIAFPQMCLQVAAVLYGHLGLTPPTTTTTQRTRAAADGEKRRKCSGEKPDARRGLA